MKPPIPRPAALCLDLFHTLVVARPGGAFGPPTWQALGLDQDAWQHAFYTDACGRLSGRVRDPFASLRAVVDQIDPAVPDEHVRAAAEQRCRRLAHALLEPDEGVVPALAALRDADVRLALVSNAAYDEIGAWPESPLAPLFDTVVFSCEVGAVKPDREIYELALARLGHAPHAALFAGDGGSDELRGARRAGLSPVLVTRYLAEVWPRRIDERIPLADHVVHDVPELAERLLGAHG